MTGGLFRLPPRFGDFYENDMMRIAIYGALINIALIVLASNFFALVAYYADANSFPAHGDSVGWHGLSPGDRRRAVSVADAVNRVVVERPAIQRWPARPGAAVSAVFIALAFSGALGSIGYVYLTRFQQVKDDVWNREQQDRLDVPVARQARYVADMRQTAKYISERQPKFAAKLLMRQLPEPGVDDVREFSWHHLLHRMHTEERTLNGHRGEVYSVAFSQSGDLLASAGKDGKVRLWKARTWQPIRTILVSRTEVNIASFSPDDQTLATVDDDGMLKLWEAATGRCSFEKSVHLGDAVMAQFTPDGKSIVTAGRTDGFAKVWDCPSGALRATFAANGSILSTDGSIVATLAEDQVQLWNLRNQSLIGSFTGGRGIAGGCFSHDGTKLATASEADRVVRLWDVDSRRMIHEFQGHSEGVTAVIFSADDQTLISAGDDHTIRLWDVATRTPRGVHLGHTARVWNLALSPDGQTIASGSRDGTVKLWGHTVRADHLKLPVIEPVSFGFERGGQTLLTLDISNGCLIERWNLRSGSQIKRVPLELRGDTHSCSAFSSDGRFLATAIRNGPVVLWDTTTGRRQSILAAAPATVDYLEFSPDGRFLLVNHTIPKARDLGPGE